MLFELIDEIRECERQAAVGPGEAGTLAVLREVLARRTADEQVDTAQRRHVDLREITEVLARVVLFEHGGGERVDLGQSGKFPSQTFPGAGSGLDA